MEKKIKIKTSNNNISDLREILRKSGFTIVEEPGPDRVEKDDHYLAVSRTEDFIPDEPLSGDHFRLTTLIDTVEEGIVLTDIQGLIDIINPAALQMAGLSEEESLGKGLIDVLNIIDRGQNLTIESIVERILGSGETVTFSGECFLIAADKSQIEIQGTFSPIRDGNNQITGILGVFRNVTEINLCEKEIADSETKFRLIFEHAPDALYVTDIYGTFIDGNKRAEDLIGYKKEDLIGKKHIQSNLLAPFEVTRAAILMAKNISGRATGPDEFILRRKDGSRLDLEISTVPIRIEGKIHILAIARDITDRKRADDALRLSEKKYRQLYETMLDGFVMTDTNGNIFECNQAYCKMLGYSREELLRMSYLNLIPPQWHTRQKERISYGRRGNRLSEIYEIEYIHKNGTVFPVEIRTQFLRDDYGNPSGTWAVVRDISERKKTEKILRENEIIFRTLTDITSSAIFVIQDDYFRYVNPAGLHLFGYSWEELEKIPFWEVVHPDFRQMVKERGQARQQGRKMPPHYELKIVNPKRGELWLDLRADNMQYHDRPATLGTAYDITPWKKAETALRRSEEEYRLLVENASDAIIVAQDNILKYFNRRLMEITGYSKLELTDRPLADLIHPDDRAMVIDRHQRRLAGDKIEESYFFRSVHKNGQIHWIENKAVIIEWAGRPASLNFLSDITDRKQAEDKSQASEKRLELALASANLGLWDWDLSTGRMEIDHRTAGILGYGPEEFINTPGFWNSLIHPDDTRMSGAVLKLHLEGRTSHYEDEYRMKRKDGEYKWIRINGKIVGRDNNNQPLRMVGIFQDITIHKKAEEALKQSQEKYRTIVSNTLDLIFSCDSKGIITFVSPQVAGYGYTPEEVIGHKMSDFIHPNDIERVMHDFSEMIKTGQEFPSEFRLVNKYGNLHYVEERARIVREGDRIIQITGVVRDIGERKIAEKALVESENRFRMLAENLPGAAYLCHNDSKYTMMYLNDRIKDLTGYSKEDFLEYRVSITDLFHPDDSDSVYETINRALEKCRPYHLVYRIRHKSGQWRWIEEFGQGIFNENRLMHLEGFMHDVTGRKEAEDAIRQSEQRYQQLFVGVLEGIGAADENEVIQYCNPAFARIFDEESPEKMIGKCLLDYFSEESRHFIMAQNEIRRKNQKSQYIIDITTGLKNEKSIMVSASPRFDEDSKFIGSFAAVLDISERRRTDQALQESEERLAMALEATSDGLWDWNIKTGKIYYAPRFYTMLGYEPYEFIPSYDSWSNMLHPDDLNMVNETIRDCVDRNNDGFHMEFRMKTKSDEYRWILSRGKVVERDPEGSLVRMVGTHVDITDRKFEEEQKQKLMEKLSRAEKMESLGLLAGGVAHDLNNILTPIVAYPDLILPKLPPDSPAVKQVQRMGKSAQEAVAVIQDLLTLARRGRYIMQPTDLNEVVKNYLDSPNFIRLREDCPKIEFRHLLEENLPAIVGSATHLSKIIMNLVVNAFDAMPDGGELHISTGLETVDDHGTVHERVPDGDYVVVRIKDTGMGIEENLVDKIFEPYYSSKKIGRSGSGLGLSVVYGILKDHNAHYDIISEVGHGTEFALYFPATREYVNKTDAKKKDLGGDETILLVEDCDEHREITVQLIASMGYRVSAVSSGKEALEYLKNHRVDLMVMDMIMEPGMDGLDTFKSIKAINPDQKAIMVTGYAPSERVKQMQELGAGELVKKPYSRDTLAGAIRNELDRKVPEPVS
nr:PAS domain S-box protein [candidate division Zixibacteria bacterium]